MVRPLDRPLLRRALVPLLSFVAVGLAGIAGFVLLADIGVVSATFWLLDPTSIELHYMEHQGPARLTKAYALAVFAGLFLTGVWTGETVLNAAFGGQIREELERVQRERELDGMEEHVVVCGYGMFGRTVVERLVDAGEPVVVIERDETELADLPEAALSITGDVRNESVLTRARVDRARALVAAIDDSNTNIQTAIVTSQLAPEVELIVRVGEERYENLAHRAGADEVVIPEVLSGDSVSDHL